MWKHVLPLTLIACGATVQARSQSVPPQLIQFQKRAIANGTEVHPPIQASWGDPTQQLERAMITNAFLERQVALRRDTEKLLSLATELKQNVDKTSPSILSMDVIKKAQEIEKLAKSVKDKMKNAY
jgi:hypothetical protein